MDGDNNFSSKEEELQYWKNLALHFKQKSEQVEQEFEDFQENSQLLERELEAAVDQAEKKERDLLARNTRYQLDIEKYEQSLNMERARIDELESKVTEYKCQEEKFIKYIRDLEQKNDDYERKNRAMLMSLGEHEAKLNNAIERNAILESEQDEANAVLQRMKDESRDLREEMKVRLAIPDNDKSLRSLVDSNKIKAEIETQTSTPSSPLIMGSGGQNMPMTAPTRISAINMVGDLLRKVGMHSPPKHRHEWHGGCCLPLKAVIEAIESKLASVRNASRESPQPVDMVAREGYRGRRISRGSTSSSNHVYLRT